MNYNGNHPWGKFLDARANCIIWLKKTYGYNDEIIADHLSMDATQVYLIRTHKEKEIENDSNVAPDRDQKS